MLQVFETSEQGQEREKMKNNVQQEVAEQDLSAGWIRWEILIHSTEEKAG